MDILTKADKYLNGNHHLLNIIFSYLGQSPSAKVMTELIGDEDMNAELNERYFFKGLSHPNLYFSMRNWSNTMYMFKKYTPLPIPRFKVDVLHIEDDVDCDRCNKLLTYPERENYGGYCEKCYGKVNKFGGMCDEEKEYRKYHSWGSDVDSDWYSDDEEVD